MIEVLKTCGRAVLRREKCGARKQIEEDEKQKANAVSANE